MRSIQPRAEISLPLKSREQSAVARPSKDCSSHEVSLMKVRGFMRLALFGIVLLGLTGLSFGHFGVSISIGVRPPPLPVYAQPPIPESGYIWTPGYWAWSDDGYYWVPGTWVQPPQEGMLWTPGYWAYDEDGNYAWND